MHRYLQAIGEQTLCIKTKIIVSRKLRDNTETMPELVRGGETCVCCEGPGDRKCSACHSVTYCGPPCQRGDWRRHKRLCLPVMIEKTGHKGNGLVASKNFKMGDLILKENASMSRVRQAGKEKGPDIFSQLNRMTADERSDFYNLTRAGKILQLFIMVLGASF